jgi:excisionase family DNA binding protein
MSEEPLVSISEACRILKVSETSLRYWTDEGKIKAFITPGGHRRYLVADLKKFMNFHHKTIGIRDLATGLENTAQLHREIGLKFFTNTPWYDRLTIESNGNLADLGRRLLNSIIRYITVPSEREDTIKEVREVGKGFGLTLAKIGLPLTDSVEAFIMHRDPILNVTTQLMKKREAFSGRVVDAIPLVARVMDEALVSLVEAHQQCRNSAQNESEKGTVL